LGSWGAGELLLNIWGAGELLLNSWGAGEMLLNSWGAGELLLNSWGAGELLLNSWVAADQQQEIFYSTIIELMLNSCRFRTVAQLLETFCSTAEKLLLNIRRAAA
jgi:imidazole glycerol phosphate synthase subunit HisF